ncbi:hypothetical protein V2G26_013113 [Clonostachys chloroleuca]
MVVNSSDGLADLKYNGKSQSLGAADSVSIWRSSSRPFSPTSQMTPQVAQYVWGIWAGLLFSVDHDILGVRWTNDLPVIGLKSAVEPMRMKTRS